MPTKTPKQHRAMAAACHGKSNLGIPKEVGCEMLHPKANQLPFSQYVKKQAKASSKPKSSKKRPRAFPKPKFSKKRPSKKRH